MKLPNPQLSINNRAMIDKERQRITERFAHLVGIDELIIEGIGPDGRRDWFQGGREKWTAELRYYLLQYVKDNDEAALAAGKMLLNQLREYIDDLATDDHYIGISDVRYHF